MTDEQRLDTYDNVSILDEILADLEARSHFGRPDWPGCLPTDLQHSPLDYRVDRRERVVPSWNAIPLRQVIRLGLVVAVIDVTECDLVTVPECYECDSQAEAEMVYLEV